MNAVAIDSSTLTGTAERSKSTSRYALCIKASKKVRWDIDADVLRGRELDLRHKFLPDALSRATELAFLTDVERRTLSQVQGRTYAYLFGLVERFISAKMLDQSSEHRLGDQTAMEALVRFGDEELKHQELFRRVEAMMSRAMPAGYSMVADPNEVARVVLAKSHWAVLALTSQIELFVQSHYQRSIDTDQTVSPLFHDIFRYHWMEECHHVVLDELEWRRLHGQLTPEARDRGVTDLIDLIGTVDGILQAQAAVDSAYFMRLCERNFTAGEQRELRDLVLRAYRWQYIISGVQHPHFGRLLTEMTTPAQMERIQQALAPILNG